MEEQQKEIELATEKAENQEPEAPAETMDDYKEELEASFKIGRASCRERV